MRRTQYTRCPIAVATLAALIGQACGAALGRGDEPGPESDREPFASPLTREEGRWLLDAEDAQRFRRVPAERLPELAPRVLPPQIRAIQESMGGSLLRQFDALQPAGPVVLPWEDTSPSAPTPATGSSPTDITPITAEFPGAAPPAPVAALRSTAAELDQAANRLEELELYRQSDALRELAQGLRVDARRMTAGSREPGDATFRERPRQLRAPRELDRPRRPAVGPVPDLAPPPADRAAREDWPSDSAGGDPDAWDVPPPQLATPADED